MKKRVIYFTVFLVLIACGLAVFVGIQSKSTASKEVKWGYTGSTGPEHWAELSEDYELSRDGKEQSPINITNAEDVDLPELDLNSKPSEASVENNGHTIEVSFKKSNNTLTIGDAVYKLEQFHFHAPSENEIDGKTYPLEGHFVYKTDDGKITVISVLYQYGEENQELKQVWDNMPKSVDKEKELPDTVSVDKLYPENKDYYNFEGSLTTPPCTEGVNWIVFKNQETISKEQVEKFSKTLGFDNNRPIQDTNGREIKE
ncbi:carbonic anhydrase [Streptococcus dentiloxodontae]